MKNRTESQGTFAIAEAQGPWASVGVARVPVDGFELRCGLRRWGHTTDGQDDAGEEWLVADGNAGLRYALPLQPDIAKPGIFRQFERLGEHPTTDNILAFANRYGFLGLPVDLIESDRDLRTHPALDSELVSGELVSYWQEEALRFRDLRVTWQRLQDLTDGGPQHQRDAHAYLAQRIDWTPSGHVLYRSVIETNFGSFSFSEMIASAIEMQQGAIAGRFKRGDLVGPARLHVHQVVNEQLRGHVSPAVPAFLERPAMRNVPDSLLSAIYFRFALDLVDPHARESICDHCHMPFAQKRRNNVYCSKNCIENARYHRNKRGAAST